MIAQGGCHGKYRVIRRTLLLDRCLACRPLPGRGWAVPKCDQTAESSGKKKEYLEVSKCREWDRGPNVGAATARENIGRYLPNASRTGGIAKVTNALAACVVQSRLNHYWGFPKRQTTTNTRRRKWNTSTAKNAVGTGIRPVGSWIIGTRTTTAATVWVGFSEPAHCA